MSGIDEKGMKVLTNVKIGVRRFSENPMGEDLGASDGAKGDYGAWDWTNVHNLLTSAGRDFLHQQGYFTTGLGANGGNYIALSTNTSAPATADTSLTGEITNGGLGRAQGTLAHNNGETTSTVTKTFTASATHTSVQKSALFSASTAGTMVHENTFTAVTLENNDQLAVAWTITLS